ncbi:MAG: Crp/Fnr family transcriptional regulator, partial [Lysobacterales bacterium]
MTAPYTGSNWIDQLPADIRQLTRERMRERLLARGEVIYTEGLLHAALWQVVSGSVRVTNQTLDGKEVVFALFSNGDCFGEISLLDGLPAANTATAVERTELLELPRPDFDALY